MATPNFDRLSKELSYKIFDPVDSGTTDGKKFYAIQRANYINNAYKDLLMIIDSIFHDKLEVFPKFYKPIVVGDIDYHSDDVEYALSSPYNVVSVYYAKTDDGSKSKMDRLEPGQFYDAKYEINSMNIPSSDSRFWGIVNGKVMFIPDDVIYYDIVLFVEDTLGNYVQTTGDDILVPTPFEPLLLSLAAREAMSDRGNQTQVQLYTGLINERKELLAIQKQMNEKKGKTDGGS